jgi:DNA invertase Pin-like site-specific DNA recombinase
LARSNIDWHRLIELCSLTNTVLLDEDGCYDPADINDALLLGLKGTMSAAELHFLRGRLQGGKRHKAERGELRFPLPVGLCWDDDGRIVLDPDGEVQGAPCGSSSTSFIRAAAPMAWPINLPSKV